MVEMRNSLNIFTGKPGREGEKLQIRMYYGEK